MMHYPRFNELFKEKKHINFLEKGGYNLQDAINQPSRTTGSFAIHDAALEPDRAAMVRLLLLHKININLVCRESHYGAAGQSPLALTASAGIEATLHLLVDHGADLHQTDEDGEFPLIKCARRGLDGDCRNLLYLLEAKANIDQENRTSSKFTRPDQGSLPARYITALFYAVNVRSIESAEVLIEQGASLINSQGKTIFDYCPDEAVREKVKKKVKAQQVAIRAIQSLLKEIDVFPAVLNELICSYLPVHLSLAVALPGAVEQKPVAATSAESSMKLRR